MLTVKAVELSHLNWVTDRCLFGLTPITFANLRFIVYVHVSMVLVNDVMCECKVNKTSTEIEIGCWQRLSSANRFVFFSIFVLFTLFTYSCFFNYHFGTVIGCLTKTRRGCPPISPNPKSPNPDKVQNTIRKKSLALVEKFATQRFYALGLAGYRAIRQLTNSVTRWFVNRQHCLYKSRFRLAHVIAEFTTRFVNRHRQIFMIFKGGPITVIMNIE